MLHFSSTISSSKVNTGRHIYEPKGGCRVVEIEQQRRLVYNRSAITNGAYTYTTDQMAKGLRTRNDILLHNSPDE